MKTVDEIVRKMREFADGQEKNGYYDLRELSTDSFRAYADLIEKAVKNQFRDTTKTMLEEVAVSILETATPTREKYSQVGNAAAMREALEDARRFVLASAQRTDRDLLIMDEKRGAYVLTPKEILIKIDDALSAPPMEASNIARLRNIIDNISRLNDEWFDTFPTEEGQTGIHDAIICEVVEADKILAAANGETDGSM